MVRIFKKCCSFNQRSQCFLTVVVIFSSQLSAWNAEVEEATSKATGGPPTSSIIRAFLENAGKKTLMDDLVKTEINFGAAMERLKRELQACIMVSFHRSSVFNLSAEP